MTEVVVEAAGCANCDARLHGPFCSACGQDARPTIRPLRRWLADEVGGALDVDGRIPTTLRALLRPGALTVAYLAGRRIPFVAPLRLALSSSLLLFVALAAATPRGAPITVDSSLAADVGAIAGGHPDRLALTLLLLLPLLAVVLRVADGWRRRLYVEHLAFALHVHAFASLVGAVAALVSLARVGRHPLGVALLVAAAVSAVYLLLAMRRVYARGWPRTVVAWLGVGSAYLALVGAGFVAVTLSLLLGGS